MSADRRRHRCCGACGLRAGKDYGKGEGLVRAVDGVDLEVGAGRDGGGDGPERLRQVDPAAPAGRAGSSIGRRGVAGRPAASTSSARRRWPGCAGTAVGFVFQAFHLMDELTAVENVELSALLAGRSPRVARRRAVELLEQVGLADRAAFLPSALSGGQRQRVAIARALSNEPTVVLADEPTGNLDSAATLDVLRLFESLHAAGQTLVIVTHDSRIAATADRLISMRDGSVRRRDPADRRHQRRSSATSPAGGLTDGPGPARRAASPRETCGGARPRPRCCCWRSWRPRRH